MTHDHWCGEHHGDWSHESCGFGRAEGTCGADYIAICPACDQSADWDMLDQEDREAEAANRQADERLAEE